MKDMEVAKKLVPAIVVDIFCLFIVVNSRMNDRTNVLEWLALFGIYASMIYTCVVWRGYAIGMTTILGFGLALQLIGGIDGQTIGIYMAFLIPSAVATLWHFAKNW